jgi:hypothetical protein
MKLLPLCLLLPLLSYAQTPNWAVSNIPAAMLANADAVLRLDQTTFVVKSPGEAVQQVRQVITILNAKAEDKARLVVPYDKFSKVTDIEGAIFDATGNPIKRLKRAEITDMAYAGDNYQDDNRYKVAEFRRMVGYPYTVEFSYEISTRNLLFYPTWMPQDDERLAVQSSRFQIEMPAGLALRYKESNVPSPVRQLATPTGGQTYLWQADTLRAIESEPLAPPAAERVPIVYTAPSQFAVQDYAGTFDSWKAVGQFFYTLNKGRDALPEAVRQQVQQLTAGEKTVAGKVQKVYAHLQSQARYISIQLGIGGWQTIEASRVAQTHYGDCKALTNYTKAMLAAVGVPAYEALVRAGDNVPDIRTDFPSAQFNHVFLCVPDGTRDTLWLECTSQQTPAGYLGDFTGNRHVLLVTPEGGKLVRTSSYGPAQNLQQRTVQVTLAPDGSATAQVRTRYTGLQQEPYSQALHNMSRDQQRDWIIKHAELPSLDLTQFSLTETPGRIPAVTETLALTARRWASPSGTRLFLPLNLLSQVSTAPVLTKPRRLPVVLRYTQDYEDSDTVRYTLPDGYVPEFAFAPVTLDSKFGSYTARAEVVGNQLVYTRRLQMHRGRYPAEAYTEYADFRKKINKADRAQLVLVKKEGAVAAPPK